MYRTVVARLSLVAAFGLLVISCVTSPGSEVSEPSAGDDLAAASPATSNPGIDAVDAGDQADDPGDEMVSFVTKSGNRCVEVSATRCLVSTEMGSYYYMIEAGSTLEDHDEAVVVDIGGPGLAESLFRDIDMGFLPEELARDRHVILVGPSWGVVPADAECLEEWNNHLQNVVLESASAEDDVGMGCEFDEQVAQYGARNAAALRSVLDDFAVDSYDVVGVSFAGARWQVIDDHLESSERPRSVKVVSAIPRGAHLETVVEWQAWWANRVWSEACGVESACEEWLAEQHEREENVAALVLLSRADESVEAAASIVEAGGDADISRFSQLQLYTNAAGYPTERLNEHLVGVCATLDADEMSDGTEDPVGRLLGAFYSVCQSTSATAGPEPVQLDLTPVVDHRFCFVDLAGDRVTPPSVTVGASLEFANILVDLGDRSASHGELDVLTSVLTEDGCAVGEDLASAGLDLGSCADEIAKSGAVIVDRTVKNGAADVRCNEEISVGPAAESTIETSYQGLKITELLSCSSNVMARCIEDARAGWSSVADEWNQYPLLGSSWLPSDVNTVVGAGPVNDGGKSSD